MTITVLLVDKSTDTFDGWVNKTNEIANLVSNAIFTANGTVSTTTGNAFGNGIFAFATLAANTALRGGSVGTSAALPITSNVSITGDRLDVGNSTVNVYINSTSLTYNYQNTTVFGGYYRSGDWYVGNSTVNSSANSTTITLANSTVTYTFTKPTAAQKAANSWFWNANGSFVDLAAGDEVITTGTSAQEIHNWTLSSYYSAEYTITVNDNTANNRMVTKLLVLQDEGDAYYTEYAIISSNTNIGTSTANSNTTHVRVYFTPTSANTTIKVRNEMTRK